MAGLDPAIQQRVENPLFLAAWMAGSSPMRANISGAVIARRPLPPWRSRQTTLRQHILPLDCHEAAPLAKTPGRMLGPMLARMGQSPARTTRVAHPEGCAIKTQGMLLRQTCLPSAAESRIRHIPPRPGADRRVRTWKRSGIRIHSLSRRRPTAHVTAARSAHIYLFR